MRWLPHRGGALDFRDHALAHPGQPFPIAVAIGADPATMLGAVTPVPDTLSEYQFAGLLRGHRTDIAPALGVPLHVPAHAEMVLEGPFGGAPGRCVKNWGCRPQDFCRFGNKRFPCLWVSQTASFALKNARKAFAVLYVGLVFAAGKTKIRLKECVAAPSTIPKTRLPIILSCMHCSEGYVKLNASLAISCIKQGLANTPYSLFIARVSRA